MNSLNWKSKELVNVAELDDYYWHRGYFHASFDKTGLYKRDFDELLSRDLSMFTLFPIEGKRVIDIGCGNGLYLLTFLKMGAGFVAGQDLSPKFINDSRAACEKNGYTNVDLKVGDCQQLQFDDASFDVAFSGDVFEHITRELKVNFINEVYRVLKPGGVFTIKTPNKDYLIASNALRRIKTALQFKNPFNVHIAHTKNNPDNEHHGLTTYREMKEIFEQTMFHQPVITYYGLAKNGVTRFLSRLFPKSRYLNPHIIITVRKPVFFGLYK